MLISLWGDQSASKSTREFCDDIVYGPGGRVSRRVSDQTSQINGSSAQLNPTRMSLENILTIQIYAYEHLRSSLAVELDEKD